MVKPNPCTTSSHRNPLRQVKTYPPSAKDTYTIAHTAQCKLKMAANSPDRNLRFVLGHAFTLDNVLLRIVEIENMSAKEQFHKNINRNMLDGPVAGDGSNDDDGKVPVPGGKDEVVAGRVQVAKTGSPGRRVSFSDNEARPSQTLSSGSKKSESRARSPPPTSLPRAAKDDDDADSTSSDDYDDPAEASGLGVMTGKRKATDKPTYSDDEEDDYGVDDEDDDDGADDDGLGLTRFASASAAPPRMIPSSNEDSDSDSDEGPASPPTLPADLDVHALLDGQEDVELSELYESVRGCPCHGELGLHSQGLWEVPVKEEKNDDNNKNSDQQKERGGGGDDGDDDGDDDGKSPKRARGRLAIMKVGA